MKRLLSILLALTLLLSLSFPAFAENRAEEDQLASFLDGLLEKDELEDGDLDALFNMVGNMILAELYDEKALPVVRDKVDTTETATVRFYTDLPNAPYMSVTDFYNQY